MENQRGDVIEKSVRIKVNRGHTSTFVRHEQKSFIDIILCTDRLYDNILHWKMEENEENFNLQIKRDTER